MFVNSPPTSVLPSAEVVTVDWEPKGTLTPEAGGARQVKSRNTRKINRVKKRYCLTTRIFDEDFFFISAPFAVGKKIFRELKTAPSYVDQLNYLGDYWPLG